MDDYKPRLGEFLDSELVQPNSHAYKEQMAKGEVPKKQKRKTPKPKSKITSQFIANDLKTVIMDILLNDAIPTIKNFIVDSFEHGVEMIFLGERRNEKKKDIGDKVSYSRYYENPQRRKISRGERFDAEMLTYRSLAKAESVRDDIFEHLKRYEVLTIGDVYEYEGRETIPPTAYNRGWISDSITSVDISKIDGKYVLELPRPREID